MRMTSPMKSVSEIRKSAPMSLSVSSAKFLTPIVDYRDVQKLRSFDGL